MTEQYDLSDEQVDVLYEYRQLKREDKKPVLVSETAVKAIREVLGASLRERGVSDPESLGLEALAGQFIEMSEDEATETVTKLSQQQPLTGGAPPKDIGVGGQQGPRSETVTAEDRNEAREKLERADKMAERTPEYAAALKSQAADIMGVDDPDELDLETL